MYSESGIFDNSNARVNKILLPLIENYSSFKKDLKRHDNSLIRSYENNNNKQLYLTPNYSININNNKRQIKHNLKEFEEKIEKKLEFNRLTNSIKELEHNLKRKNLKYGIKKERIIAHNNLFFHPMMSQFLIHPQNIYKIENHYNRKIYNRVFDYNNDVFEGQNPLDHVDEVEGGVPVYYQREIIINKPNEKESVKSKVKTKSISSISTKKTVKSIKEEEIILNEEERSNKLTKNWKKCRAFVNIALYYFIHKRLSRNRHKRNELMEEHRKSLRNHQQSLTDWFKTIEKTFIDEFFVYSDLNLAFNNFSGSLKLQEQSEKIVSLLNLFLKNLLVATANGKEIPFDVLIALNHYCLNNVYFAKKLLTTYEIFRLDFNLNGTIRNQTETTISMLIVFFTISKTFIQRILLKIHEHYPDFKNYKHIALSLKYFSSVLQHLIDEAYDKKPDKVRNILAYLNYLKNYKVKMENIITLFDSDIIRNNSIKYTDVNEFSSNLVDKEVISEFFNLNKEFCDEFKRVLVQWGTQFGMYIRKKLFSKNYKKK